MPTELLLHVEEAIRIVVFLAVLAALYALAAMAWLSTLITPLKDKSLLAVVNLQGWHGNLRKFLAYSFVFMRRLILAAALLGLLCLAYAYFIEPNWLEVKHINLTSPKLSSQALPLRIAQISDLHCREDPKLETHLPDVVASEAPDVIVFTGDTTFTGDTMHGAKELEVFKQCFRKISAIAPTFAVTGNTDAWSWRNVDVFAGTGARQLRAEAVALKTKGNTIWIAGVPVDDQRMDLALSKVPQEAFTVFLDHYSDRIYDAESSKVDLYLCGHTHGGQIALPFYGALVTFAQFGKRFESGLYHIKNTWLYVNRGIGTQILPLRFGARPELTIFTILPAKEG